LDCRHCSEGRGANPRLRIPTPRERWQKRRRRDGVQVEVICKVIHKVLTHRGHLLFRSTSAHYSLFSADNARVCELPTTTVSARNASSDGGRAAEATNVSQHWPIASADYGGATTCKGHCALGKIKLGDGALTCGWMDPQRQ
jgi:hypothetical protein